MKRISIAAGRKQQAVGAVTAGLRGWDSLTKDLPGIWMGEEVSLSLPNMLIAAIMMIMFAWPACTTQIC